MEQPVLPEQIFFRKTGMGMGIEIVESRHPAQVHSLAVQGFQLVLRQGRGIEHQGPVRILFLEGGHGFRGIAVIQPQKGQILRHRPPGHQIPHRFQAQGPGPPEQRLHFPVKGSRIRLRNVERQEQPGDSQFRRLFQPPEILLQRPPQSRIQGYAFCQFRHDCMPPALFSPNPSTQVARNPTP